MSDGVKRPARASHEGILFACIEAMIMWRFSIEYAGLGSAKHYVMSLKLQIRRIRRACSRISSRSGPFVQADVEGKVAKSDTVY